MPVGKLLSQALKVTYHDNIVFPGQVREDVLSPLICHTALKSHNQTKLHRAKMMFILKQTPYSFILFIVNMFIC